MVDFGKLKGFFDPLFPSSQDKVGTPLIVLVLGAPGSGKSQFVNVCSDQKGACKVGHGQSRCTNHPKHVEYPFKGDTKIALVDTPGIDFEKDVAEVAGSVTNYLRGRFGDKAKVSGIVYTYPITNRRLVDQPPSNLPNHFQKLCSCEFKERVVVATTMWGVLLEEETGVSRQKEFEEITGFRTLRYNDTTESAREIVDSLLRVPTDLPDP